jgi:hypothetical protein
LHGCLYFYALKIDFDGKLVKNVKKMKTFNKIQFVEILVGYMCLIVDFMFLVLTLWLVQCWSSHRATWCSGPMRGWLYNWARDRSETTLGLSETHAINGHCTCTVFSNLRLPG